MKHGARLDMKNKNGDTAIDIAEKNSHWGLVKQMRASALAVLF